MIPIRAILPSKSKDFPYYTLCRLIGNVWTPLYKSPTYDEMFVNIHTSVMVPEYQDDAALLEKLQLMFPTLKTILEDPDKGVPFNKEEYEEGVDELIKKLGESNVHLQV